MTDRDPGAPGLRFDAAAASLVGRVRVANEDSYVVTETLVAVADGMGGHAAGEVASAMAVETVSAAAQSHDVEAIVRAVLDANSAIHDRSLVADQERGMGTTLCVAAVVRNRDDAASADAGESIAIVNVGDSRIYLLADESLHQLTEDHSLVETLVREGRISEKEAATHPQRNVLTRALGVDHDVSVDAWILEPRSGDRLLLCSDGLFNEIGVEQIKKILVESLTPEAATTRLSSQAETAGGRDNITAVVADIVGPNAPGSKLDGRLRWLGVSVPAAASGGRDPKIDTASLPIVPPEVAPGSVHETDSGAVDGADQDDLDPDDELVDPAATVDSDGERDDVAVAEDDEPAPRSAWRTAAFLVAILLIISAGLGAIWIYARGGWTVTAQDDSVVIHRGRVESFPLIGDDNPRVASKLKVSELTDSDQRKVERGRHYDSRADAKNFVASLKIREPKADTTTTTTTTTTAAPTTVAPTTTATPVTTAPTATTPAAGP